MESFVTAPQSIEQRLRAVIGRALDVAMPADRDDLVFREEPRWDSVAHLQLILEMEEEFGVSIDNEDVLRITSFRTALGILRSLGA